MLVGSDHDDGASQVARHFVGVKPAQRLGDDVTVVTVDTEHLDDHAAEFAGLLALTRGGVPGQTLQDGLVETANDAAEFGPLLIVSDAVDHANGLANDAPCRRLV